MPGTETKGTLHLTNNVCFIQMVPIGGGSTKSVLRDRWIVYTLKVESSCYTERTFYMTHAVVYVFPQLHVYCGIDKFSRLSIF